MTQTEWTTALLIALGIAVLGVLLMAAVRWRRSAAKNLQQFIQAASWDTLTDVVVPDGSGGEIHIEYLLLTARGLLLLEVKDMQGAVFAGERMNIWSASHDGARLTFDNPIPVLEQRVAAINSLAPLMPIDARVVFINQATFPKGHPSAVSTVAMLSQEYLHPGVAEAPSTFPAQWETLKQAAVSA